MKKLVLDYNIDLLDSITYSHTPSMAARSAYFYVQSIGHYRCNAGYFTRREGLRTYLLLYTIAGKGHARYRGKQYELTKGTVLLMDCYDFQEYYSDKKDLWDMKWIHFSGTGVEGYHNIICENYSPVIHMMEDSSIPDLWETLAELMHKNDIRFEIKASCILVQILTNILLAASVESDTGKGKSHNQQVESALEFIEKNYASHILLEDMAEAACSSVYHFTRVFKRVTGFSPYEYLVKYRINKAKSLLKTSNLSIEEISVDVGFEDTSNFIKTFRKLEEMTPLKYRKYWMGS